MFDSYRALSTATNCTSDGFDAFNETIPAYFDIPIPLPSIADGEVLMLRCTAGRALAADAVGFQTGGYLGIACTDGNWVETVWPLEAKCEVRRWLSKGSS